MNLVDVPNWPRYSISDEGDVISKDMCVGAKGGKLATRKGRVLSLAKKSNGYLCVTLTNGKKREQILVHRLVALAFHGAPPYPDAHVLHGDGDKTNNRADNLRWGTPADNHADTEKHGHRLKGDTHPLAKLTSAGVLNIRASALGASELAREYKVSREHIWAVRRGRIWRHLD